MSAVDAKAVCCPKAIRGVRVGIVQSNFIPWRGYFDFIATVDLFVFLDDVQFTKRDWRSRNLIKTAHGPRWLSVPVKAGHRSRMICDTEIDETQDWRTTHVNQWRSHYAGAPFLSDVFMLLDAMNSRQNNTVTKLNLALIESICTYLNIGTPRMLSSQLKVEGRRTERLINLLRAAGGTTYLSGPSADTYLEKDLFVEAGIRLEYKSYKYEPYPQLWGAFEGRVSVLDLIANCGPASVAMMQSSTPDRIVVP